MTTTGTRTPTGPSGPNAAGPHPTNPIGAHTTPTHNPVIKTPPSKGSRESTTQNGSVIRTRSNGKVSDLHDPKRGMDVHQGLNGSRRVSVERPDHSRMVYERGRPGYVQRGYSFHGQNFERRTYSYGGRTYDHFYHGYRYHGVDIEVYAPSGYFGRGYYGWAYNPWAAPIRYRWGWMGNPWYGYYGGFFTPYPVYPSAAFWLTDYLISSNLQAAYAAQQETGEANGNPSAATAPLSPDVKQMIADEVRNQLALENQEAQQNAQQQDVDPGSSGIARMMSDAANGQTHVFVVDTALDVVDSSGTECPLSDGDALLLRSAPAPDATAADLRVLASKGGQECPKADTVSVAFDALQEMQNHMRESIDQGLQELKTNQGKGGLPVAPVAAQLSPAVYTALAPPPDPNAANEIQQQAQQADQAVNDASTAASQQGQAATATIAVGQTFDEVETILGPPVNKAIVGSKVIYNYKDLKVIFMDGRVADVE